MRFRQTLLSTLLAFAGLPAAVAAEAMLQVPAYSSAASSATVSDTTDTIAVAGGCFWGVQGVFQHLRGVTRAVSGYAGGAESTAHYETVGTGQTGHAETVEITFDPRVVTYAQILQVFFSVAHDPTQLNRQGPDMGTQYRSAIFPRNDEQARIAADYIAQLGRARVFPAAIVTRIETGRTFYPAETYHQDFLERNPRHPYIVHNDLPKVAGLKRLFPASYRPEPVLVMTSTPLRARDVLQAD